MNIEKVKKLTELTNIIDKCTAILASLDNKVYPAEFTISYRGTETCELEEPALNILIKYYKKRLQRVEQELEKL